MNLSELIDTHRGARSYSELSRDCGGAPTDKRLQQMVRTSIKNFPDPPSIKALAQGLRVPEVEVVLAAAESLGLDVRRKRSRLVELLPEAADHLTEEQASAVAHLLQVFSQGVRPLRDRGRRLRELRYFASTAENADELSQAERLASRSLLNGQITQEDFDLVSDAIEERRLAVRVEPKALDVLAARQRRREEGTAIIDAHFERPTDGIRIEWGVWSGTGASKPEALLESLLERIEPKPQGWDEALKGLTELYASGGIDREELVEAVDAADAVLAISAGTTGQLAARSGTRRRSITDQAQNEAGEHDQDLGGMDPS